MSSRARSKSKCGRGKILRKGAWVKSFTRADGTRVKGYYREASCVQDRGLRGKTPPSRRTIQVKSGGLGKYGYSDLKNSPADQRRRALRRAIDAEGYATIIRALTARINLNRNQNPTVATIMERDRTWIQNNLFHRSLTAHRDRSRNRSRNRSRSRSKSRRNRGGLHLLQENRGNLFGSRGNRGGGTCY